MKNSTFGGVAAAISIFGMSAMAVAQDAPSAPVGVSFRVGGFFPIDTAARDSGSTWFGFGAQAKILHLGAVTVGDKSMGANLELSIDYFGRNQFSNTPILANYVVRTSSLFYSAGAGIGFMRTPDESRGQFAYQVGVGYQFGGYSPTPFFMEAKFWGCQDTRLNGFGIYAGVRL